MRLDKQSRLLYKPSFGANDNVNAPVMALRTYSSDRRGAGGMLDNSTKIRLMLSYTDVRFIH